ncbi:hypothetical protein Tco_0857782 [Tanacetum coccineum]|uniref:Uncharacterized protein n=1 Tax=Tanacetum coccineum TaxID=301880 RepID=A0ABQ5B785_9ASTR
MEIARSEYTEGFEYFLRIQVRKARIERNKYTEGLGTLEDQEEGRKPNKYTIGMGTFRDQAERIAGHF